ncbi:hypothetical protein [Arcobacter sp.]|uniref:hypothetical protein n=1 Tax=Arcobacter sp. TaxID=1872629 RepID=UPI003D13A24C
MKPIYLIYLSSISVNSIDKNKIVSQIDDFAKRNKFLLYNLSSNLNYEKEETIKKIKKDKNSTIILIVNNRDLFTNFNRPTYIIQNSLSNFLDYEKGKAIQINIDLFEIIECLKKKEIIRIKNSIENVLCKYGNVFNININLLIEETSYIAKNNIELLNLIEEDLNLFEFKYIFSSRLSIILYRLAFFDLNAKATSIGNFYREELKIKSQPYSFKGLNNNHLGFYFTDLINKKSFRGYKLVPYKQARVQTIPNLFLEKISIAKRLLKLKVKIKIVAEALEIDEATLNTWIYGN